MSDASAVRLVRDPLMKLSGFLAITMAGMAQTAQPPATLVIAGQPDQAPLVRMNGKSYVDIESLARIAHGTVRFEGNRTILTLPGSASSGGGTATTQPAKIPQLSGGYLSAEIEALTQVREWRAALVNAIQNNYPVTDSWVSRLRRTADAKLDLAVAAATSDPDQKAVGLLRNEFTAMQQESDQFVATHAKVNYISPDSLDHNALDQKILDCEQALVSMAGTKQYQDEFSCH